MLEGSNYFFVYKINFALSEHKIEKNKGMSRMDFLNLVFLT